MTKHFVDGVMDVTVIGGVTRLEFFTLNPKGRSGRSNEDPPALEAEQTLSVAMPVEAFFKAVDVLNKVRNEIQSGNQRSTADAPAVSPNFKREH